MTVYRGIKHPNEEPKMNRFRDAKRKTKFTEEVAAACVEGDFYLCMEAPGGMRYAVEVDGEMVVVTHQLRRKYGDWDKDKTLEWQPYDYTENLVIKVKNDRASGDWRYAALNALEDTVHQTPLGRAVGRDAMRPVIDALSKTLGVDIWDDYVKSERAFTVNTEENTVIRDAVRDLLEWAPELDYPDELGEMGAKYDNVGFAEDADAYIKLLDSGNNGEPMPLLTQPVYYAVLGGKHDGRSLNARLDAVRKAVGLDDD